MKIQSKLCLHSSDQNLVEGFHWAKEQALSYVSLSDPVGPWYEAALPGRHAFCMRDVAHQTNGAHVLGLDECNFNMLYQFASYISESRDWCTYWELTKDGEPASVDYKDDDNFWYNLPANFDFIDCCLRQYHWTGNNEYIENKVLNYFYDRTVTDYIDTWDINKDGILEHLPEYGRRGLASYSEGNFNIVTASDLIAAQYAGYKAYSDMQKIKENHSLSIDYYEKALGLREHFNNQWWDEENNKFYGALLHDGSYYDISNALLLYFDGVNKDKQEHLLQRLYNNQAINVEEMSYYPETLYKFGKKKEAYNILCNLINPNLKRREYPEVSFSVIGTITTGLMGIQPDATKRTITTKSGLTEDTAWCQLQNVPVFEGSIDLRHDATHLSTLTNNGIENLTWRAYFEAANEVLINGKKASLKDSFIDLQVEKGQKVRIEAFRN
ncbi:glucosidase family protein [Vallitalea okinawensis]|uniref:hypothetical protein n=1 Tax=Vallitalea okinawensis TaxID=2078660 RepID=UPI000CFA8BE0|nr:hypothetical protein [Vallitalea okinawensis]